MDIHPEAGRPEEGEAASLVSSMSHILSLLSEARQVKSQSLDLSKWVLLRTAVEHGELRVGRLGKAAGETRQTANRAIRSLVDGGLVVLKSSASEANAHEEAGNIVQATEAGRRKAAAMDAAIAALVLEAMRGNTKHVGATARQLDKLAKGARLWGDPRAAAVL